MYLMKLNFVSVQYIYIYIYIYTTFVSLLITFIMIIYNNTYDNNRLTTHNSDIMLPFTKTKISYIEKNIYFYDWKNNPY